MVGVATRLGGLERAEIAALVLAMYAVAFARGQDAGRGRERKLPRDLGSWMGMIGFAALGVTLLINLAISIDVAQTAASPVYPPMPDRIFLQIALWGFAAPMAWGYSTRFVTVFLSLEPPIHRAASWLSLGIAAIVVATLAREFLFADVLILLTAFGALWALRVFRPSVRPPKVIGTYRHYPAFVRLAYVWLVVGAALGLLADLLPRQAGLGGASRHAVTVGFLATLIFAIAPRILPSFLNGRQLYSAALMAASLWVLTLGCFLRVLSESIAYSIGGRAWEVLPISALLELTAVVVFVVNLALTLGQRLPAWFGPDDINASLPLYWYVKSFPQTRSLLVRGGLKTLDRMRDVPRSLSLAGAAAADGADIERLLAELRTFFSQRQPRRVGR